MRKILAFLFVFLATPLLYCGSITVYSGGTGSIGDGSGGGGGGGGGSFTDITLYWNMDSMVSGVAPQTGVGTFTIGSGYTLTSGVVGTGGSNNNNTANATNSRISISTASGATQNIDMSKGRIGFYYCQMESGAGEDGDLFYGTGATSSNPKFYLQNIGGTTTMRYKDKTVNSFNSLSVGTTYFLEVAWDSSEALLGSACKTYVDGVFADSCGTGSSGADPAPTSFRMGGLDANTDWVLHDQLMISNDPTRDLYAVRNRTSF